MGDGGCPWRSKPGLYFPLYSITRDNSVLTMDFKLRAFVCFAGTRPIAQVILRGVTFEFSSTLNIGNERRYTSEIRPIIGTHVGSLRVHLSIPSGLFLRRIPTLDIRARHPRGNERSELLSDCARTNTGTTLAPHKHFFPAPKQSNNCSRWSTYTPATSTSKSGWEPALPAPRNHGLSNDSDQGL